MQASKFKVPQTLLTDLKTRFPELEVSEVEWSWEVPGKILEAEFDHNGMEYEVEYSISGAFISMETPLDIADVPTAVINAVEAHFPGASINEAEHVEFSNGVIHIELDILHEDNDFEAHFHEDGSLILTGEDL